MSDPNTRRERAERAHRVLQAVWVIASARHDDAVARDIAAMGTRLRQAITAKDWPSTEDAIEEVRTWLSTMAGVVTARLTSVFDEEPSGGSRNRR